MRKLIAAINMTVDGYCDHTAMTADDELHEHYNDLLRNADTLLYGRITYQLMEDFWPAIVDSPTGNKPIDEFAVLIDNITKIVYSRTLDHVEWKNSILKREILSEDILAMKEKEGKPILAGSPGLIVALTNLGLIDEYQLCIHPVIAGKGLPLFKNIGERQGLELTDSKTFRNGVIAHYYGPVKGK